MKKLILIATLFIVTTAAAKTTKERTVTVQAQGITLQLNKADIDYLKSRHKPLVYNTLVKFNVIRNNEAADLIISLLKGRR